MLFPASSTSSFVETQCEVETEDPWPFPSPIPLVQNSPATKFGACSQTLQTGQSSPTFIPTFDGMAHRGRRKLLVGQLNYPIVVSGRYVIKRCDPPKLIRYLSQTHDAGFATERTISLEELRNGTLIRVEAFLVGQPAAPGSVAFLQSLTVRWLDELSRFCDSRSVDSTAVKWG